MMSDSDQLIVNESTLEDVLQFVRKYRGDERSSKPTGTCQPSDCVANTSGEADWGASFRVQCHPVGRGWKTDCGRGDILCAEIGRSRCIRRDHNWQSCGEELQAPVRSASSRVHDQLPRALWHARVHLLDQRTQAARTTTVPSHEPQLRHNDGGMPVYRPILPAAWIQHQADQPKIEALQRTTRAANDSEARCK
jgi:hypothetical protein